MDSTRTNGRRIKDELRRAYLVSSRLMRKWIMRLIFVSYEGSYVDEEDGDEESEYENGVESDDSER